MSRNWLRAWDTQVAGTQINPELRIRFSATQYNKEAPGALELTVTNMNIENAHSLKDIRGKPIQLSAGYQDNVGVIFNGKIVKVLSNIRENKTDTAVVFYAEQSFDAYRYGHVNKTLKAGSTGMDVFQTLLKTLSNFGVVQGNIPTDALKQIKFPRAHVLYGDTSHHLRKLSQDVNAQFHFGMNGQLHITPADGQSQSSSGPIEINSATGMVGLPIEQEVGIIVRFLINPQVTINGMVKINNADIQEIGPIITHRESSPGVEGIHVVPQTGDGVYKVVSITWDGDSRGNTWYGTAILNNPKTPQVGAVKIGLGGVTPGSGSGGGSTP